MEKGFVNIGDLIRIDDDSPLHLGARVLLVTGYRATVVIHDGHPHYKITQRPSTFYQIDRQRELIARLAGRGIGLRTGGTMRLRWYVIIVLFVLGTWLVYTGASHDSWRRVAFGLLINCIAFGQTFMRFRHPTDGRVSLFWARRLR